MDEIEITFFSIYMLKQKQIAEEINFDTIIEEHGNLYRECFKNRFMTRSLPEFELGEADAEAGQPK
jgi:hypothetical protein